MLKAIAIGMLGLALVSNRAAAQTAVERAQILRDFQKSVVDYTQQHKCLAMFPEAVDAATPASRIFTLPVAMVFRQEIARALAERDGVTVLNGVGAFPHPQVLEPFPSNRLFDFPRVLADALPPLPTPLEYRLLGHDLVVRDKEADLIIGVLRDAVGNSLTVIR